MWALRECCAYQGLLSTTICFLFRSVYYVRMDYKTYLKESALRKARIIAMRKKLWTWKRIADFYGITPQRAQQIGKAK